MARPYKARRVCQEPSVSGFGPLNQKADSRIELSLEEYESIRLIDLLACTQEECAGQMGVARTTVQAVYDSARRKIADCLVNGRQLDIRGGNYLICPEARACCGKDCGKRRCPRRPCMNKPGGYKMKIAVTYEDGQVFQHFGHCEEFKVYEVEEEKISSSQVIGTGGSGHEALAVFLKNQGVETLICGGIGQGARAALSQAGIELYPGVSGSADEAVGALLKGNLDYDPDTVCRHHHEDGENHSCHGHGHKCGS